MEISKARKYLYFYDYSQETDSSQCLIVSLIATSYSEVLFATLRVRANTLDHICVYSFVQVRVR